MTGRRLTKGRTGRDDDPERLLSLDLNLVDEFVLLDNGSPNGGSTASRRNGVSLVTLAFVRDSCAIRLTSARSKWQ
jgi:hypothetical protein